MDTTKVTLLALCVICYLVAVVFSIKLFCDNSAGDGEFGVMQRAGMMTAAVATLLYALVAISLVMPD